MDNLLEIKDAVIAAIATFSSVGGMCILTFIINTIMNSKKAKQLQEKYELLSHRASLAELHNAVDAIKSISPVLEDISDSFEEIHELASRFKSSEEDLAKCKEAIENVRKYLKSQENKKN